MKSIILDGRILADYEKAHDYLKEELGLPEYYGKNLDALYDCLTEMQDTEIQITEISKAVEQEESFYFKRMLRVFREAAEENENIKINLQS